MTSFWIELDGFFSTKNNFGKPGHLPTSKMKFFVTIFHSWKLLTSAASSLDPRWLDYDFHRTAEGCSDVNSLVVCVDGGRPNFVFIPNTKCSQDFNETALEALSMPEKVFSTRITKTIKMKDAKIQKPWIDTLFRGAKVVKSVSHLRLEFKHWFHISRSVFLYKQRHFLKCEIVTVIVGKFHTILSVNF